MSALTNEPGRLPSQTVQNPKGTVNMVKMSDMKEALEEAAQPSLSTTEVNKEEFLGMMWEDESYAQAYGELIAPWKDSKKHKLQLYWQNNNEDQQLTNLRSSTSTVETVLIGIKRKTDPLMAEHGSCIHRYAFTVNMTPPPVTNFSVPASGWDDNEDLDGPRSGLGTEKIGAQDSSYFMKIIASEDHATKKNKEEKGLKPRNEQDGLMTEKLLTWSHEAQLEMSKDPGAFTVTCGIGKAQIHHCLIDLGAAVNVLPYPLYCSSRLGPLKPPRISLELGDKSCVHPVGVLERLMLRVGKLVVPTDFYVIPIGESSEDDPPTIILGRPFLYTTRAKIDMGKGSLSLAFGGRNSDFCMYANGRTDTKKPPL
ncbi:unnamed protein product [Rhodiola kirilowii]